MSSSPQRLTRRVWLALLVTAALVGVPASAAVAAHDFDDVAASHPFHEEISWLVDEGVAGGFGDGTFRPTDDVTRQAAAAFLYRLAGEPSGDWSSEFDDVPSSHPFHDEIAWAADQGITGGYDDGTFRPGRDVTRQAAAAFLDRAIGEPAGDWDSDFADVPASHPFHRSISFVASEFISTGFGDGTYRPAADVTRQAMAAFLARTDAAGYVVDPGDGPTTAAGSLDR